MELAEKILSCEEIKLGVYKCRVGTKLVSLERLGAKHSELNRSSTEVSHGRKLHKRREAVEKNLQ